MAGLNMKVSSPDFQPCHLNYCAIDHYLQAQYSECSSPGSRDGKHNKNAKSGWRSDCVSSKDASKRIRVNRTAKLKQCKLDALREQWLSQELSISKVARSKGTSSSYHLGKLLGITDLKCDAENTGKFLSMNLGAGRCFADRGAQNYGFGKPDNSKRLVRCKCGALDDQLSGQGTQTAKSEATGSHSMKSLVELCTIMVSRTFLFGMLGVGLVMATRPSIAWGSVVKDTVSPARTGVLASAWTGLIAGCLHTLTGPDHLIALAPLCIGRTKMQSAAVGALWGCGHDAGQILFGLVFLLLKDRLHMDFIRTWATRIVGLTLVTIGGMGISDTLEAPVPVLIEKGVTKEVSSGAGKSSLNTTTFTTGVVYGLQPDALLMILPALALPTLLSGAAYLGMFLLGTVLAMGSYTLFLSSASQALQKRLPGITKQLTLGSACVAIILGLGIFVGDLVGISLF